jgi:hypothetical protein
MLGIITYDNWYIMCNIKSPHHFIHHHKGEITMNLERLIARLTDNGTYEYNTSEGQTWLKGYATALADQNIISEDTLDEFFTWLKTNQQRGK